MPRIWTPAQPPPDPAEIQVRSPEASVILSVLRRAQRRRPDGRDYYRCLYTKEFGAPPDASISGNSQSTTDFSQATGTQAIQHFTQNMRRCNPQFPSVYSSSNSTAGKKPMANGACANMQSNSKGKHTDFVKPREPVICTPRSPLMLAESKRSTETFLQSHGGTRYISNAQNASSALISQSSAQLLAYNHFTPAFTHIDAQSRSKAGESPLKAANQKVDNIITTSCQKALPTEGQSALSQNAVTDLHPLTKAADHKATGVDVTLGPVCATGNATLHQEDVETDQPLNSQIDLFLSQSSSTSVANEVQQSRRLMQDDEEKYVSDIVSVSLADVEKNKETGHCSPPFDHSPGHYDNKEETKSPCNTGPLRKPGTDPQNSAVEHNIESQKTLDSVDETDERKDLAANDMSHVMQDAAKQTVQLLNNSDTEISTEPITEEGGNKITVKTHSCVEGIKDLSFDIGSFADNDSIMENFPTESSQEGQSTTDSDISGKMPQSQDESDVDLSKHLSQEQIQQTPSTSAASKELQSKTERKDDDIQTDSEQIIVKSAASSLGKLDTERKKPSQASCETEMSDDKECQVSNNKGRPKDASTTPYSGDKKWPLAPGSAIHRKLLLSTPNTASVPMDGVRVSDSSRIDTQSMERQAPTTTLQSGDNDPSHQMASHNSLSSMETPKQQDQQGEEASSKDVFHEKLPMEDRKRATPGSAIQAKLQSWTKAKRSDATPSTTRTSESRSSSGEPPAKKRLYSLPQSQTKKRAFLAPFKGDRKGSKLAEEKKEKQAKTKTSHTIKDASIMTQSDKHQTVVEMLGVKEVGLALVYGDGTSQLREPTSNGIPKDSDNKAVGIAVAFPSLSSGAVKACGGQAKRIRQLQFIMFPLHVGDQTYRTFCRDTLIQLMTANVKKVCLDAQELILTLISHFALEFCSVYNWSVQDPKVAGWLLNPDHPPNTFTEVVEMLGKEKVQKHDSEVDTNTLLCQDLSQLLDMMTQLTNRLQNCDLLDLYLNVEMKLTPILAGMEHNGICVTTPCLIKMGDILKKRISTVEADAYKAAGHRFLLSSHVQLRTVLFDELHLDERCANKQKLARTSVNNLKSTSESVLLQLQDLHPLPKLVLEYRKLEKMKSTYVDGILACIKEEKLTATWDHTSAATGRLTSANPNIQSVPKQPLEIAEPSRQTTEGGEHDTTTLCARDPYVAREGCSFLAADFQSIEFRLLAHFSKDPSLLKVFQGDDKKDVFIELTSQWMNIPTGSVQTADRERTKRVVYSIMYGVGPEKLATYLNVSAAKAKGFISSFLWRFPGVSRFTHSSIEECKAKGHVRTILKRWRLIPNIKSPNFFLRSQAERQAVNFVVQGSAADICKLAMIQVVKQLAERGLEARLLIQLHDELVFEVPDQEVDSVKGVVKDVMQSDDQLCGGKIKLEVPLRVSVSAGKSWGKMTDLQ